MTKYSKYNPVYRLQKWLDSVPGQTFMNYAYSWGASIVILGALFKLTHLPGANFWLFLGMGTEVFVFFIAGFDRPFDKTEDGKDLPTHVDLEGLPTTEGAEPVEGIEGAGLQPAAVIGGGVAGGTIVGGTVAGGTVAGGGGTIIIGGGSAEGVAAGEGVEGVAVEGAGAGVVGGGGIIGGIVAPQQPELPDIDPEEMEEATQGYVEQLKALTETLKKVSEQSERLTRDSEEMENLNRTLTGISRVYEMQLKSASAQISTIDEINEQTKHMAEQIQELNKIYARMIEAMQIKANI